MIGIGCLTYNRPAHLELWKKQMDKFCPNDAKIYIADDTQDRKGVAFRSNECLAALKDCDHIFIFNDDCFPIKEGWAEFFISTGENHLLYLKETPSIRKIGQNLSINSYDNCGGCFMYLTKEVLEKVGGFNKKYSYYGYEHAGYSLRIHEAGFTPQGAYLCPEGAGEYIYSLDYDFHLSFDIEHQPSIKKIKEVLESLAFNEPIFREEVKTIYHPL